MNKRMIGAVEAGGTKFVLALAHANGDIVAETRIPTQGPRETFAAMADFFSEEASTHGEVAAFGVASFGPIAVDPASPVYGTLTTTPKQGWSGARYQDALGQFGAPIVVDTDVNGAALGEWGHGAGKGAGTLAYTTVGTGIGTGIVRHGRPVMGFTHLESGHITIARDPARDPFGGICPYHADCLEGLASGPAIEARWQASLSDLTRTPGCVDLVADYLAQLAVNLVLLHMPDRLIFGGGVSKTPGLLDSLRRQTERRLAGYVSADQLDPGLERYITAPGLGDRAGITGALMLAQSAL